MSQVTSFVFHTLNADGSVNGTGCFSYEGPAEGVDIQYNFGTSAGGTANKMLSFWYHDPVTGTLDISALINFNWTNGWQGSHYRFDFNLWNFPHNSHGLTAGQAQPGRPGPDLRTPGQRRCLYTEAVAMAYARTCHHYQQRCPGFNAIRR